MSNSCTGSVDRFCHQYLQLEPDLEFPEPLLLKTAEVQDALFNHLFAEGAVPQGPPPRYQLRVLKELMFRVEASIDDWHEYGVSDDLMSTLSVLLATPLPPEVTFVQQKCHVTYHISALSNEVAAESPGSVENRHITLLEHRALISAAGTTGLRTWEAALHLGNWLFENPYIVRGKRILELGAGTGYLSILCAGYLGAEHVIASDGSERVIYNLTENFLLNNLQDSTKITPMEVKWGHALLGMEEEVWNGGRPVDVVLGADITYDHNANAALVATLLEVFTLQPAVEVYISATQRNERTFKVFLDRCRENHLSVDYIPYFASYKSGLSGSHGAGVDDSPAWDSFGNIPTADSWIAATHCLDHRTNRMRPFVGDAGVSVGRPDRVDSLAMPWNWACGALRPATDEVIEPSSGFEDGEEMGIVKNDEHGRHGVKLSYPSQARPLDPVLLGRSRPRFQACSAPDGTEFQALRAVSAETLSRSSHAAAIACVLAADPPRRHRLASPPTEFLGFLARWDASMTLARPTEQLRAIASPVAPLSRLSCEEKELANETNLLILAFPSIAFATITPFPMVSSVDSRPHLFAAHSRSTSSPQSNTTTTTKMNSSKAGHNSSFALQKYMVLQEQHEELCSRLDSIRPQLSATGSIHSSPTSSPTRSSFTSLSSTSSSSSKRHSRSGERRHHPRSHAPCSGWDDINRPSELTTIVDEETICEISAEEQRLFDVNESIKRALTELLNCNSVRGDRTFRMWVQTRLMETEKELRSGRRRRSNPNNE
ncbi:hypothetical protein G7046_g3491 [Stylonectria norvegica]|nr:hypothetical protein G7046_g3491 [Stylonectria norvegica]